VLTRPRLWVTAFLLMVTGAFTPWRRVPTGFIPTEDKRLLRDRDAASLTRHRCQCTQAVIRRVEGFLHEEPSVVNVVASRG
jgi:multidrug efflux pump subunit AcrB